MRAAARVRVHPTINSPKSFGQSMQSPSFFFYIMEMVFGMQEYYDDIIVNRPFCCMHFVMDSIHDLIQSELHNRIC